MNTPSIAQIARILGHAKKYGAGYVCTCPCHDDQHASLSLTERDGKLLFKCHAGCGQPDLVAEFRRRGWLNGAGPKPDRKRAQARIVATFPYTDEAGDLLYEVVRYEPKDFKQRRPDGKGGWIWSLGNTRRVLYRLPELLEDLAAERTIFIAEGERKVDLLRSWNIPATCNGMGAAIGAEGAKKWLTDFADILRAADAVLLPDNDENGRKHVETVAASLAAVGARARVLDLPGLGPKGDVVNWAAAGGTAEQLLDLVESNARPWRNGETEPFENAEMRAHKDYEPQGERETLAPAIAKRGGDFLSEYKPISYTWGGFVPSSSIYGVTAKTGHGKTALLICGSIAVMKGNDESGSLISKVLGCEVERGRVAYITKENPDDFRMKLATNCFVHGIDREFLNKQLLVLDGRSDSPEQVCEVLQRDAERNGLFQLIPYDTFQAGYAGEPRATDFNENLGVLRFVERLRKLCGIIGKPTVLVGCHPIKSASEDQLIPFGGGSSYNELDGNLTLWKDASIKLHWTKVRGPEFDPRYFYIEKLSCPDIVGKKGRQIALPVMRPATEHDVETRERGIPTQVANF